MHLLFGRCEPGDWLRDTGKIAKVSCYRKQYFVGEVGRYHDIGLASLLSIPVSRSQMSGYKLHCCSDFHALLQSLNKAFDTRFD